MKKTYKINGMTCSACAARIERVVGKKEGISNASVNFASETLSVEFDNDKVKEKDITEVMTSNESLVGDGLNRRVVANHTAYAYMEAANYEHEGQGAIMNYSGVEDDIFSALAEHEDWQPGYDY